MNRRIHKVVIPAAGLGKRLRPATHSQPKEMLPVGRKPTIQYVVEEAVDNGIRSVLIVTGRDKRAIEDHFDRDSENGNGEKSSGTEDDGDFEEKGVSFFFVRQSQPRGLADAVSRAEEFASDDAFVVALGDTILYSPPGERPLLQRLIDTHLEHKAAVTVAVETVGREDVHKYGIVAPRDGVGESNPAGFAAFELSSLVEKPSPAEAPSQLAIASRYVFNPDIFDAIRAIKEQPPGKGGEFQLTDAIRWLLQQGRSVWAVQLGPGEVRYDIGNFGTYFKAFVELSLKDREFSEDLREHISGLLRFP
ncbi:MAG: UTP--glucose-1-phosphate uridylyltransferase [Armatimonadetes bacterium]|nr:UTP--glucose-1-phosphate uridylyltransferase [Armatimonadota bacterium]